MKRFTALILALFLVFSAVGCSTDAPAVPSSPENSSAPTQEALPTPDAADGTDVWFASMVTITENDGNNIHGTIDMTPEKGTEGPFLSYAIAPDMRNGEVLAYLETLVPLYQNVDWKVERYDTEYELSFHEPSIRKDNFSFYRGLTAWRVKNGESHGMYVQQAGYRAYQELQYDEAYAVIEEPFLLTEDSTKADFDYYAEFAAQITGCKIDPEVVRQLYKYAMAHVSNDGKGPKSCHIYLTLNTEIPNQDITMSVACTAYDNNITTHFRVDVRTHYDS